MKRVLAVISFLLFLLIIIYAYLSFCFSNVLVKGFLTEITLQLMGGFFLALAVLISGIFLEERRAKELKINDLNDRLIVLQNLVSSNFDRGKSSWNFSNRTPSFYFDNNWIVPIYDLLTQNDRRWEVFLHESIKLLDDPTELILELNKFIILMNKSLINAEKLDNELKLSIVGPGLAASLGSVYVVDRNEAQKNAEFKFWIFRATWAGANSTEILFGYSHFSQVQLKINRIESLMVEALSLDSGYECVKLIKKLKADRKKLVKQVSQIKKIIEEIK
ncbi:MAG: hypothetical protein HN846_00080 [Candidatus Pacebacteria bacterium]|jgi:hypothetical protein|nr:hypothetical protein [Candidatus Paceibacterota bacterium]MBT3512175.1 hypothetical protein [Candidatus Paceibacterota bacterium]MBT4004902.1 hypothetical protein [Candidatus Paceibacterota bacterium]MBT4358656.1 hypothetical protein [Candidatus Paceibacterota bacterium]MBT4681349.1 hypothetical protein [Candidatus Paceibacterota bacterium]